MTEFSFDALRRWPDVEADNLFAADAADRLILDEAAAALEASAPGEVSFCTASCPFTFARCLPSSAMRASSWRRRVMRASTLSISGSRRIAVFTFELAQQRREGFFDQQVAHPP